MAEATFSQDELTCPVCVDLLKDPVTIQCGHSYCKSCITGFWDREDQMRVYSCPQCRQTFSPRPALEDLKKTKLPADGYAGAGDVQCGICTGGKYKAVKSCLVCLNSYCQNHLEQHESLFKGKKHNLTDALDDCRRWSARNMRSFLLFSVSLTRSIYVCCVRWMNIKTTTLYQLQHRGQRNRYLN